MGCSAWRRASASTSPELFPTRLRGTGAGFCFNTGRYCGRVGRVVDHEAESLGAAGAVRVVSIPCQLHRENVRAQGGEVRIAQVADVALFRAARDGALDGTRAETPELRAGFARWVA